MKMGDDKFYAQVMHDGFLISMRVNPTHQNDMKMMIQIVQRHRFPSHIFVAVTALLCWLSVSNKHFYSKSDTFDKHTYKCNEMTKLGFSSI